MTTFVPNPRIGAELEASEDVRKACIEKAEKVADYARSIAPVLTGAFVESIHVEEADEGAVVLADSVDDQGNPDSAFIEFGTSDTPAHGTLRQAIEAAARL